MSLNIKQIFEQATTAHQEHKFELAEKLYRKILLSHPKSASVYNNLAALLDNIGKIDESVSNYKKAIEIKPDFIEAYFNLAKILVKLNKLDEAKIYYKKIIELKSDIPEAYKNLGIIFSKLNKLDEAEKNYKKSIEVENEFINIVGYIKSGDWESSEENLEKFCLKKIHIIKNIVNLFIEHWCIYCQNLLGQNNLSHFTKIFTKLIVIGERNQHLNSLINFLFNNYDLETILKDTKKKERILVNLSYIQYKFSSEEFHISELLVQTNINEAMKLINENKTENLGWFVVRRSLSFSKNKKFSRKILDEFIKKMVLEK